VLFSQPELAAWMSDSFECAWEPLRDVPRVSIDFGEDRVVRRTLHGNVVTWICDAEGRALDALGGLYAAAPYRARLEQAALLATYLAQQTDPAARAAAFHDYHARQAERTAAGGAPLVVGVPPVSAFAKVVTERATELAIVDPSAPRSSIGASKGAVEVRFEQALGAPAPALGARSPALSKFSTERPLERALAPAVALDVPRPSGRTVAAPGVRADKGLLEQDTTLGETRFRPAIHRLLAESGSVPYASLTKSVYRDVLRVDLDDPWLGLHELLFDSYPFDV
jgi:hypothetical protein